jgi:hypothetical protein
MEIKEQACIDLLVWLEKRVLGEGGDGDAIWVTKWHSIEFLLPIVMKLNETVMNNWWTITTDNTTIILDNGQESLTITTDQDYPIPEWSGCTIFW